MKIEDFGTKIGGARKDLWKDRNLQINDILSMNDREMVLNVKKNNVWKKPDFEALVQEGHSILKLYFIKRVRDAIPSKPKIDSNDNIQKQCSDYIEVVHQIEKDCMAIQGNLDIMSFYKEKIYGKYVISPSGFRGYVEVLPKAKSIIDNKVLRAVQVNRLSTLENEIKKKQFLYSENEKILADYTFILYDSSCDFGISDYDKKACLTVKTTFSKSYFYPTDEMANESNWEKNKYFVIKDGTIVANNFDTKQNAENYILALEKAVKKETTAQKTKDKKMRYIPPQLRHIIRNGENYRHGRNVNGNDYLNDFQFRGGEFGNYMNEADRLQSLNFGYDALLDLSKALHIEPKDISLNGQLSIAFGARGHGNALAHYEPTYTVINLTKMRGAGSLAHEWGHALDDYIGKKFLLPVSNSMATSHSYALAKKGKITSLNKLMQIMKYGKDYETNPKKTQFYSDAIKIDTIYSKQPHGYWASNEELFARAFACYIHDKLEYRSDYLCGHAYTGTLTNGISTYPKKEEMKDISQCFDELFEELKTLEMLHDYTPFTLEQHETKQLNSVQSAYDFTPYEETNGQFSLFDIENEMEMDY